MFGAAEPRLRPLPPAWAARVETYRSQLDPAELGRQIASFPGPRNRFFSPEAMTEADRRIRAAFGEAGWEAAVRPFSVKELGLEGANVVAAREGLERDVIVLVAHHDTVPDSVGADDNTASVVSMLNVARMLAPGSFRRTLVFAAVDMEETGFFGARALVEELRAERDVVGAIVLETMSYTAREPGAQSLPPMVGALYRGQVRRIRARGSVGDFTNVMYRSDAERIAVRFAEALEHLAGARSTVLTRDPLDLAIAPAIGKVAPFVHDFARSDHVPFWEAGLPAIMVNDTANFRSPNYHMASDTVETLDLERLADITAAVTVTIENLAGLDPTRNAP